MFDWDGDGNYGAFDAACDFEMFEAITGADEDEYDDSDFDDFSDGDELGLFREDFENDEEYEEAVAEARGAKTVNTVLEISFGNPREQWEHIKPEDFPNKRRYEAALTLAKGTWCFEDFKKRCIFIGEKADKILAANYFTYNRGFIYAQAIKDNFDLPCALPDEDEEREMDFCDIIAKIAKRDIPLAFKVWEWCLEQFAPYIEYCEYAAEEMSSDVLGKLFLFMDVENFQPALVRYMDAHRDFFEKVYSLAPEYIYDTPDLSATAIKEEHYDIAEAIFKKGIELANGDWQCICSLTYTAIDYLTDDIDLVAMEWFRDNLFPLIKAIPDGMVQDEIPGYEKTMSDFIYDIEKDNEKYVYTRRNSWRTTVPDGKEYGISSLEYDSEEEYMEALNEEKYGWREWQEPNDFGIDINDFETEEEYWAAVEEEEEKREQERFEKELIEAAKDKKIYTYCGVSVPKSPRPLSYRTDDETISIGDTVIVPYDRDDREAEGTVVSVGQYLGISAPYPVEKTKMIIRKK